jgi:FlaA1/EpsC-like NDP-sugar epimerase
MLKVNGVFLFETPVFYGINHGFYNFSPTLFYDYFSANNYVINQMVLYAYSIKEPQIIYEIKTMADDICYDIPQIDNRLYYMLCGSVTKTAKTTCDVIPQQRNYRVIWELANGGIHKTNARKILTNAEENSVYLYGTGNHTRMMLDAFSSEFESKIAGIISNEPEEISRNIRGYKIHSIDEIKENSCIIISSVIHQNIIYERIKHLESEGFKIVKLYCETQLCNRGKK